MISQLPIELVEAAREVLEKDHAEANLKKWAGKSILKTENGMPMHFYHGTGKDFKQFSYDHVGKGNDSYGAGFYFTNKPEVGSQYAFGKDDEGSPNVQKVHIRLENPIHPDDETPLHKEHIKTLIQSAPNHKERLSDFADIKHVGYQKALNSTVDAYEGGSKFDTMNTIGNDFYKGHTGEYVKKFKQVTGHDGVIVKNDDHIIVNVFHPNQIKSAVGNSGAYNRRKTDITEDNQSISLGKLIDSAIETMYNTYMAESVKQTYEGWLHVEHRAPMTPIEHVRNIIGNHEHLGWELEDDKAVALYHPLVTSRGGGCQRTVCMRHNDGRKVVLHMKFRGSQNRPHTDYKINREFRTIN